MLLVLNLNSTFNCIYIFCIFVSLDIQCKVWDLSHIGTANECEWGNFCKQVLTTKSAKYLVNCLIQIFLEVGCIGFLKMCFNIS